MEKNKLKTIVIITLSIIIIIIVGVYAYNYIQEQAYNQGVKDVALLINQQMINSLVQDGYISFLYTQDNQTYQLKLGVME
ncbi:hypothetical protein LCGC14_0687400 [marine sediment metagenome]|uniref:Uncharacterized protein n=1 Tax=marine sediment metagenome TaxID=412755 RepID=A0A0F9QR79_9ZZZZ